MDEDICTWGSRHGLTEHTVHVLMQQGYCHLSELCQVSDQDLRTFALAGVVSDDQCAALRAALASVPASLLCCDLGPGPCEEDPGRGLPAQGHGHAAQQQFPLPASQELEFPHGAVGESDVPWTVSQSHSQENDLDLYDPEEFDFIHASLSAAAVREDAPREGCGPLQTPAGPSGVRGDGHSDAASASGTDLETIRLLLAGKTGNGKSTTGNSILGRNLFDTAPSFGSVTAECERQVAVNRNKRIEVMDSPGLYDTDKSHEEICTIIVQAVVGMHPGPHAILYVLKVGRFTREEHDAYRRLKALFDDTIARHVILVFTHGDQLEQEGTTLQELIQSPKTPDTLREVFEECGHRCVVFNNTADDKGPQVDALFHQVQNLVARNGGRPYTCPKYSKIGEGLEEEVNKRMAAFEKQDLQRQKYVQALEQQTKDAEMAAEVTRQEFEEMEVQRQREMEREERRRQEVERDLQKQLSQQKNHTEKQKREVGRLQDSLKHMGRERDRLQKDYERKKRQHMKELDRKMEAAERERRKMREEQRRRDKARDEEMERMKSRVVQKKEPGFLSKGVDFVAGGVKKVLGFFGL